MFAANATGPEVQRYLRQQERGAVGETVHSFEVRRRIAVMLSECT